VKRQPLFRDKLIVWINSASLERSVAIARDLRGCSKTALVSPTFFLANGPHGVRCFFELGIPDVILDMRILGDSKEIWQCTTAAAVHGAKAISVHALAGTKGLEMALEAAEASKQMTYKVRRPLILGSLLPASMDDATIIDDLGLRERRSKHVERLARRIITVGADGIIAEYEDIKTIRRVSRRIPLFIFSQRAANNFAEVQHPEDAELAGITEILEAKADHVIFDSTFVERTDVEWAADLINKELEPFKAREKV